MHRMTLSVSGSDSAESLLAKMETAVRALREARDAVADLAPHGRNYIKPGDGDGYAALALDKADHRLMVDRLSFIRGEIEGAAERLACLPGVREGQR